MSLSHHGLSYPPGLLDALKVHQQRPLPHPPIRILDGPSFASIHLRHLTTHAPDSVLFPFLHGLEGSNQAQNLFFSHGTSPGGRLKPAQVPPYRGLIWVVCDQDLDPDLPMPGPQSRDSSDDDEDEDDDLDDECFSDGSSYVVDPDQFAMDVDQDLDVHIHPLGESGFEFPDADDSDHGHSHMHPVAHRPGHVTSKTPVPVVVDTALTGSYHSLERRDSTASSTFSASTESDSLRTEPTSSTLSTPPTSIASSALPDKPVAKQPLATSPPSSSPSPTPPQSRKGPPILTSTFYEHDLLQTNSAGEPEFILPKVPDGISLRNFGIQVPIYATLSDIVVYSPKGLTPNAVALAEKFKIAVEKKMAERRARLRSNIDVGVTSGPVEGPDPDGLLSYNVFVLSATYEELCELIPSLIRRPSGADPHPNTVDFAEREKKEMRELTRASEIISIFPPGAEQDQARPANPPFDPVVGQVFLGNANDVPLAHESHPSSPASSAYLCSPQSSRRPSTTDLHAPVPHDENGPLDPNDPFNYSSNDPAQGFGYDICVECHEFAPCPGTVHFHAAEEHFRMLDAAWVQRCRSNPAFCNGAPIPPRPPPNANAVIHFPFPSSPSSNTATVNALLPAIRFLERMLQPPSAQTHESTEPERAKTSPPSTRRWSSASSLLPTSISTSLSASCPAVTSLHASSATGDTPPPRPLKILLYSSDGYTESSVPALCLLMAVRRLSLPEAYLELQVARRRSFFVYHTDLGLLRRVEARLAGDRAPGTGSSSSIPATVGSGGRSSGGKYISGWSGFSFHGGGSQSVSGVNGNGSGFIRNQGQHPYRRPAANSISLAHAPTGLLPQARMMVPSQGHLIRSRPRANTSPWLPSLFSDHQAWFNDPRFDGSFPSRVLPFLYLGNLNHASNAYMLHALGITHVVSVGECALVPPPHIAGVMYSSVPTASASHHGLGGGLVGGKNGPGNEGSLWVEAREGRIKVLDIKGVCDDGIDTLEPQLSPICDWIERARLEGGQVLVHCRVGVSRSATVTIAYVMKHLGLPLVDAYLIVRSRRLSVLIQPNMRLLYNLCGWEVKLAQERAGDDEQRLRGELAGTLNWPFLAKEVHSLNEKYLH